MRAKHTGEALLAMLACGRWRGASLCFVPLRSFPRRTLKVSGTLAASTSAGDGAASLALLPLHEPKVLPEAVWRAEAETHRRRVAALVGGSLSGYDGDNAVYNFIFRYYFWKPSVVAAYR